jgi:hypothetical protein
LTDSHRFTRWVRLTVWLAGGCACLVPAVVSGQWLHYPTAGVPKGRDGKPNLRAPAPRAVDGRPDFSGVWYSSDFILDPSCPPNEPGCIRQEPISVRAFHIGLRSLLDHIPTMDESIALLPYQPWAADLVRKRLTWQQTMAGGTEGGTIIDPHARCLPPNFPRAWDLPQYKRIVQTRGLVVILHEFQATYRQIWTDGRPLPIDPQPSWNGYSTGHWEGDTLVVETTGFRDDLWLDTSGSPLTAVAHVTERIRRATFGQLNVEVTINDPKAYTRPWSVQMNQALVLDTDLLDDICLENERDAVKYIGK